MAEDESQPGEKPGADGWKPPTREEWEAAQRQLANKLEEAARVHKKLADLEAARKAAEEEEAKKRGEYEGLYKQEAEARKALEARVKAFEEVQEAELAELVQEWDDDTKALIPPGLPVHERLALARRLAGKLFQDRRGGQPTRPVGGRATQFNGYNSAEEWAERDPSGYLEAKRKDGKLRFFSR